MASCPRIAIIDYQGGNLQSAVRSFDPAHADAFITGDPRDIAAADGLVLPGVGAFSDAMRYMDASGQSDAIKEAVFSGTPILGICLGMQVLFDHGTEGSPRGSYCEGLGILAGECVRLEAQVAKVPHVGWNTVSYCGTVSPLFTDIPDESYFYFTHSYYARPTSKGVVVGTTADREPFASAVAHDNIFGVQFHPEKSSTRGLVLVENFVQIVSAAKEAQR